MSDLALTSLTLSHFRSHKQLRLELDGRPVSIFGPNGSGKTNILEAISFLSPGRGLRRAKADQVTRRPETIGWRVQASLEVHLNTHEIETRSEAGAPRTVRINGKVAPQLALSEIAPVVWLIPAMDRLWIESAEGRRRFLDRLTMSLTPDHGHTVLAYEKAMRDRNRLLKDGVRDGHWYKALEVQMADLGMQVTAQRRRCLSALIDAQDQTQSLFPKAELALTGPDESAVFETSEALLAALSDARHRDLAAGRTLNGPHRDDLSAVYLEKAMAARDCSTGEQKALLVSLILASARALKAQSGRPPLVLLDEVAAHLDRNRQAALYDEVCALGVQAWMTGTEASLFDALGHRAQFVELPLD